jgi:hypothetical protein
MAEHLLFLTGKLAEKQMRRTLEEMSPDFEYTIWLSKRTADILFILASNLHGLKSLRN